MISVYAYHNKSLEYFAKLQGTTLFLYIIRWQQVQTKSGPFLISWWNDKITCSTDTLLFRLLAIASLLLCFLCNTSSGISNALMLALCNLSCSFLCTVCSKVSDSLMLAMHILFCSCLYKVRSRVSDALSQALCNLSLAFLADFTLSDCIDLIRFIAFSYTLLFVWIERHDHSVHMSSVLQVQQFYTASIPLLEAYLLPMANNRTRKERPSQEQNRR